jgi:hypothetical protein
VSPTALGFVLIGVGVLDAVVGFVVILPRATEASRPVLRAALLGASALLVLLGGLLLTGWLEP